MSDQPPSSPANAGPSFCAECGAAMPADARFCGSCGAAPPGAAVPPGAGSDPTQVGGAASSWQGVAPIVERDPTEAMPTTPPPPPGPSVPAGPPPGPPAGGPPPGAPPSSGGKSKGPLIAAIVVVLALLVGGGFLLLGGDDDGDDESADIERDEDDEDEETTTTTEADEETTTTTAPAEETTSTTAPDVGGALTFTQVLDDTGVLVVEVPDFWEVNGAPLGDGSANILAAESIDAFVTNFGTSGMSYTRLPGANADPDATIDFLANTNNLFNSCAVQDRQDYSDGVFTGRSQLFANCQPSGASIFEVVGTRADGVSVEVTIALAVGDDEEIINQIQRTFNLTA